MYQQPNYRLDAIQIAEKGIEAQVIGSCFLGTKGGLEKDRTFLGILACECDYVDNCRCEGYCGTDSDGCHCDNIHQCHF